jgi:hypothetical protein
MRSDKLINLARRFAYHCQLDRIPVITLDITDYEQSMISHTISLSLTSLTIISICTSSVNRLYVRMSVFYQSPRYDIRLPVSHRYLGQYTDINSIKLTFNLGSSPPVFYHPR